MAGKNFTWFSIVAVASFATVLQAEAFVVHFWESDVPEQAQAQAQALERGSESQIYRTDSLRVSDTATTISMVQLPVELSPTIPVQATPATMSDVSLQSPGTETSVAHKSNVSSALPQLVWGATFDFFFDNREYKNLKTNWSQTLFGARINPEVGVTWNGRHSLMIGVSLLANFGAKPFVVDNEIFGYYQFLSPKFRAYAGVVPRSRMIGEYSGVFFSDSVKYYDPNMTGLLLQYMGGRGYVEFGCDWNSMFSKTTREKFLLFSAARLGLGAKQTFFVGYNLTMYHHAGWDSSDEPDPDIGDGVVDNVLIEPFVGVDFTRFAPCMQELSLSVGWINGFQNDRSHVGKYVMPGGVQIEAHVQKWNFGIYNTLYVGDDLMPYFVAPEENLDYGPGLYWGEPFYRTDNLYNRLEVYWQPIHTSLMSLRISSVHHYDGYHWGWQQKLIFTVNLGQNRIFNRK